MAVELDAHQGRITQTGAEVRIRRKRQTFGSSRHPPGWILQHHHVWRDERFLQPEAWYKIAVDADRLITVLARYPRRDRKKNQVLVCHGHRHAVTAGEVGDHDFELDADADCGNSGLHVHGDLRAKLLFDFQCSIEVRGSEAAELDKSASPDQLRSLGIELAPDQRPAAAVREYFRKYDQ